MTTASSSTEAKQAEFFCEAIKVWDEHIDIIPRMALLRMNDITRTEAEDLAWRY